MSSWGLTDEQRQCRPWGIEPQLLAPQKTITDPIHGEVFVTELERRIIDTRSFQRLRRIRQLGTAHLVYPAATNSRFSHALGALRAAQDILNVVLDQRNTKGHVPDIFDQWNYEARGDKNVYNERVGRAVVLCRLGALLHDIGHVPFGHTLEDDLRLLVPHDENEERFTYYWNEILKTAKIELDEELVKYLKVLVLSGTGSADALPRDLRFVKDLIGNTICADLLDYLPRDHYFSGLPAQLGKRFLDGAYVRKTDERFHWSRFTVRLFRNNRHRVDVVTELYKYLQYRYELNERLLYHHAKVAADVMLGKLVSAWHSALADAVRQRGPNDLPLSDAQANQQAIAKVEEIVRDAGDDSLLEMLYAEARKKEHEHSAWRTVARICDALLSRRLYKLVGRCTSAGDKADDIYREFGSRTAQLELESRVAELVGADPSQIALWIPSPKMREKVPEVVVQSKSGPRILAHESSSKGREIIKAHHQLWSISLYVEPGLDLDREVLLAAIADELEIDWDAARQSSTRLIDVLVSRVCKEVDLTPEGARELKRDFVSSEPFANYRGGSGGSFKKLLSHAKVMARKIARRHAGGK